MNYLIYTQEEFLIKEEIKKIQTKLNITPIIYDLSEDNIKTVIEDANTASLFNDKKLIICNNANIFTSAIASSKELEQYLNNPNKQTTIIFTLDKEKIDNRKKISKLVKKIEYNYKINIDKFIKDNLKNYNIDNKSIHLLKERVGHNLNTLYNEINKIKIYKNNDKNITIEDIKNLTHKNIDTNIFTLIDNIVQNKKNKALEIYYEMLKQNEEPIKILITLANQFRIMYQSKELIKRAMSQKDIAQTLEIHPYRVKLAIENSRKYDSKLLLKYINQLADLDIKIKTGQIDKNLGLELFILEK